MSEQTRLVTADELNKLMVQFQSIKSHDEQCRFYHDNPALHSLVRGVLFPKPEESKPE